MDRLLLPVAYKIKDACLLLIMAGVGVLAFFAPLDLLEVRIADGVLVPAALAVEPVLLLWIAARQTIDVLERRQFAAAARRKRALGSDVEDLAAHRTGP